MTLLTVDNLFKKFNSQIILDGVSFTIQGGDRIALVGKNGIGKTTLLEILAGKRSADSGDITRARTCEIDYVEQEKTEFLDQSLHAFVADARRDLLDLPRDSARSEAMARAVLGRAKTLGFGSLYDGDNAHRFTEINLALQARELLHRDVDYLVRNDRVVLIDDVHYHLLSLPARYFAHTPE